MILNDFILVSITDLLFPAKDTQPAHNQINCFAGHLKQTNIRNLLHRLRITMQTISQVIWLNSTPILDKTTSFYSFYILLH